MPESESRISSGKSGSVADAAESFTPSRGSSSGTGSAGNGSVKFYEEADTFDEEEAAENPRVSVWPTVPTILKNKSSVVDSYDGARGMGDQEEEYHIGLIDDDEPREESPNKKSAGCLSSLKLKVLECFSTGICSEAKLQPVPIVEYPENPSPPAA